MNPEYLKNGYYNGMSYEYPELRTKIIISANKALLGAITSHLRSITVDFSKTRLILKAIFDNGATEDEKNLINTALSEMAADLWQEIDEWYYEPVSVPYPEQYEIYQLLLYLRFEEKTCFLNQPFK